MCGGLVTVKEDVIHCLQSGAIAVFYDAERFCGTYRFDSLKSAAYNFFRTSKSMYETREYT